MKTCTKRAETKPITGFGRQASGIQGLTKPRYTVVDEVAIPAGIDTEAHRVLQIWGDWKRAEGGVVTLGYPRKSAGLECVGPRGDDAFDHRVEAADRRTGVIAEAILDEMENRGHRQQVMAIWNRYFGDVARFRGDQAEMLIDGCRTFLAEAKKKGIAV